jgi:hypothetical protein
MTRTRAGRPEDRGPSSPFRLCPGLCLSSKFGDGGGDLLFPGFFGVPGRIVGEQRGDVLAELPQQGGGAVQGVPSDVGLAVGPGVPLGGSGVPGRWPELAQRVPEPGQRQMSGVPYGGQAECLLASGGKLFQMKAGQREQGLRFGIGEA